MTISLSVAASKLLMTNTDIFLYYILFYLRYPCPTTVCTLLLCGADVNACDNLHNTPLHVYLSSSCTYDERILKLLCDAGAHLDYANESRKTPIDMALNSFPQKLLKSKMKISLKCLCARVIRTNNVPFHDKLTPLLVQFVQKH